MLSPGGADDDSQIIACREDLLDAAIGLDDERIRQIVFAFRDARGTDVAVVDVLIPILRRIGTMWEDGRLSVLHEHVAAQVVRSVVDEFGRPFDRNGRPTVVLACPPGELHDLPLHLFAAMLRDRGWAPVVLGSNTPWGATAAALRAVGARACVISGIRPASLLAHSAGLTRMSHSVDLYLAGPARQEVHLPGVTSLPDDFRVAASILTGTQTRATG